VPGIEDFTVRGGEEHDAGDRRAIGIEERFGTVQDPATSGDPVGMLATAPELPPAGDAVAAIDDPCIPGRPQLARGSDMWVTLIDFAGGFGWEIAAEHAILAAERQTPAGGSNRLARVSSTTRTRVIGSVSSPPNARGIHRRNRPARAMASTSDSGRRRDCSISSDSSWICGANPFAASMHNDGAVSDTALPPRQNQIGGNQQCRHNDHYH
jgi:hypothetical protein